MSGNSGDNHGGQDGQPQREQLQGGQPQGEPPQDGPPPQGEQPSQGQPPGGQPQGRTRGGQSFADQNQILIDWTKFMSILLAIAGAGLGLFFVIFDALDQDLLSPSGGFGELFLLFPIFVVLVGAPLVGAALTPRIQEPQQEVFKISFATLAAGTFILTLLSAFLISTTFDGPSIEFGGLLITAIVAAVFAGGTSAGGSWAMLNQYPDQ